MPNYYMIITTEIDYEWDIENEFKCAGFSERNQKGAKLIKPGDKIIYYVTKKSKFVAAVEVVGEYYFSEQRIWDDPFELWPHRVKTAPLVYVNSSDDGIYIKDIWDNLSFIKNKVKWGSQVQGSFRNLNEHDYNHIYKSIIKKRNSE